MLARIWTSVAVLAAVGIGLPGSSAAQDQVPSFEDRALEALASPELKTFASEQEVNRYLREASRIYRRRHPPQRNRRWSASDGPAEIVVAQADVECVDPELCPEEEDGLETIVVTGSRVSSPAQSSSSAITSITNTQVSGVDEGDIVKQ